LYTYIVCFYMSNVGDRLSPPLRTRNEERGWSFPWYFSARKRPEAPSRPFVHAVTVAASDGELESGPAITILLADQPRSTGQ
jgi:hypothetical protein